MTWEEIIKDEKYSEYRIDHKNKMLIGPSRYMYSLRTGTLINVDIESDSVIKNVIKYNNSHGENCRFKPKYWNNLPDIYPGGRYD
jgi:hypothetical protein